MRKLLAFLVFGLTLGACVQADPDQYKALGPAPVYGESNGWFYDATNDYLSGFVNDVEVAYIDSSGNLTMDGSVAAQSLDPADDAATCFGTGDDFCLEFNAADATPDCAYIGVGAESNQLVIGEVADTTGAAAADLAIAQQTNPTVVLRSADATDAADYLALAMDQTNCVVDCGQGVISIPDGITSSKTGGDVLTLTGNAPTVTLTDNQGAALSIKSSGTATDFMVIDTTTGAEELTLKGDTTVSVFRVDTGVATFDEQVVMTAGFSSAVTGADAITLTGNAPTMTLADNKAAAFAIKSSGTASDFIVIDTQTGAEELTLKGDTGISTFRVDVGTATFDEVVTLTAGFTSAVTAADVMTCTGAAPTITLKDNEAAALAIKTSGTASDWIVFDTQTGAEELTIKGDTGISSFRVDTGTATFDEVVTLTAGFTSAVTGADVITLTGNAPTVTITDNQAVALAVNSSGTSNFFVMDTTTGAEELNINGVVATSAFRVDTGLATFDEEIQASSGMDADGDVLLGGGASALTFDAASSSVVCTDNVADGLDFGAPGATTMIRLDTQDNAEQVIIGNGFKTTTVALTGVTSLDNSDCGRMQMVTDAADADLITLPATVDGCELKFMFVGSDGGALIDISPAAADAIHGSCTLAASVVEFNGTDDNDIGLTKGTANTGDTISLIGDGDVGWFVTTCTGIWANN